MGNEVILSKDKLRELVEYDFSDNAAWKTAKEKEDWTVWKEYGNITDIYKKTALDVALTCDLRKKEGTDCFGFVKSAQEYFSEYKIEDPDSNSPLLQKIYGMLWEDKYLEGCKVSEKIKGETMNSIWTTLYKKYNWSRYTFLSKYVESRCKEERKKSVSEMDFEEVFLKEDADKSEFVSNLDEIRGLRMFLESTHRLGNFIPVPKGCNGPRGSGILKDYWDLTLKVIYDYYAHKEEYKTDLEYHGNICKIVGAENVDKYKAWLDSFENWDNFVRKNYMRAFVNIKEYGAKKYDDNEHYGEPRELWDDHFENFFRLKGSALPEKTEQAEQFFERASFCIHERSLDMIAELEKVLNEEES